MAVSVTSVASELRKSKHENVFLQLFFYGVKT